MTKRSALRGDRYETKARGRVGPRRLGTTVKSNDRNKWKIGGGRHYLFQAIMLYTADWANWEPCTIHISTHKITHVLYGGGVGRC